MKVADLIEELDQVPPEKTVLISRGGGAESITEGPEHEVLRVSDEMEFVLLYFRSEV